MKKVLKAEVLRKEFAMDNQPVRRIRPIEKASQEVAVESNKPSFVKRVAVKVALTAGLVFGTVVVVDMATNDYSESAQATICWDCTQGNGAYKTPKEAIKAVNPDASERAVIRAIKEFQRINNLPEGVDYKTYLKAGTYEIPVIK